MCSTGVKKRTTCCRFFLCCVVLFLTPCRTHVTVTCLTRRTGLTLSMLLWLVHVDIDCQPRPPCRHVRHIPSLPPRHTWQVLEELGSVRLCVEGEEKEEQLWRGCLVLSCSDRLRHQGGERRLQIQTTRRSPPSRHAVPDLSLKVSTPRIR